MTSAESTTGCRCWSLRNTCRSGSIPRIRHLRKEILVPAAPGLFEAYPVSTEVNRVSNNNPHLIDPLPIA